jgi:hypothetical protein
MSNILTFPTGGKPPENVPELHNPSLSRAAGRRGGVRHVINPPAARACITSCSAATTFVTSSEAELIRDAWLDVDKAGSKAAAELERGPSAIAVKAHQLRISLRRKGLTVHTANTPGSTLRPAVADDA